MATGPEVVRRDPVNVARHRLNGEQPAIGALVSQATSDLSQLVRDEVQLAKAELKEKGKEAGVGAGLFGGAGAIALYGLGVLIAAAVLGLATALPAWLSALIVAVLLFAIAGIAALLGKRHVARAAPPVPQRAVDGVHDDLEALKGHQPEGRSTTA
ncbi:phage holin family protein [Kribbella sp. NPDC048915]|uniref:phage holin family protein n=1 Tax=Kribbella sp. NPDC048915 TaxID=3155148 RepID=UPI003402025C